MYTKTALTFLEYSRVTTHFKAYKILSAYEFYIIWWIIFYHYILLESRDNSNKWPLILKLVKMDQNILTFLTKKNAQILYHECLYLEHFLLYKSYECCFGCPAHFGYPCAFWLPLRIFAAFAHFRYPCTFSLPHARFLCSSTHYLAHFRCLAHFRYPMRASSAAFRAAFRCHPRCL